MATTTGRQKKEVIIPRASTLSMPRDFRRLICIRGFADDRNAIIAARQILAQVSRPEADWSQLANDHAKKLIVL